MAVLTSKSRNALARSQFAVPSKAPGSGSYPIPDASHARNALARSAGKPVAPQVKRAVAKKFPKMGSSGLDKAMSAHADKMHPC